MEQAARNRFAYQQTASDATSTQQHQQQHHHRQQNSISQHQLGTKRGPAYFVDDDDDTSILDPAILDADIMQSPNHQSLHFRKDSFANSSGVISPADTHSWDPPYASGLPVEHAATGHPNHFHDDNNGFVRHHSVPQVPVYHHQPPPPPNGSWSIPHGSGHCTPSGNVEIVSHPPNFEAAPFMHHRQDSAHGRYSQHPQPMPFNAAIVEQGLVAAPQVQTPMSPHSHQDWMAIAQQEMDSRPVPKRMRPTSPPRTMVDFQRRDGIRKKNGRIDIPQERNIHTIDNLIEKTKDEDLLKELKQQKRLLRNREAALASRQRKKKHTEDLEGREKSFSTQVNDLERTIQELTLERDSLAHDRQILVHRQQEAERVIETMHMEKRDMIMKHTEETSSLRKKVQVLVEQLDAGPAAMSANPSSTGFTDFNAEMEALSMGAHEWDFTFVNDLNNGASDEFTFEPQMPVESVKRTPVVEKKASTSTIVPIKATDNSSEQPVASGLLFMLLLCGAFVASRPNVASSSELPITPDVRAAAPAVLNNLLSEVGASATHQQSRNTAKNYAEPIPSNVPQVHAHTGNRMDQLQNRITSTTRQQEIDSAFSLTTAQYAALTNDDYADYNDQSHGNAARQSQQPHRTLAESLAHIQPPDSGSKAEVYTRSLLFDQIPTDVVKQFRDMVRERERLEAQEQLRNQDQQFYKLET